MRSGEVPQDDGGYEAGRDEVGPMKEEERESRDSRQMESDSMESDSMKEIVRNGVSERFQHARRACIHGGGGGLSLLSHLDSRHS
jgi:hypothetical protein